MADKGLNIADVLRSQMKTVSGPDTTGRESIEYIDIELLEQDPDNFYQLSKVEELAGNISVVGLQQPVRVRPSEGGRYMIVSGHRRRAALQQLVEAGEERFRQVPCIVEQPEASAAMQKLRLIYANSDTRSMTSAELSQQVKEVEDLLYQLKEEGVEFKGKMRDHVAQICNVKATKLANLKVIREKLAPCWEPYYKKATLNETVALALARMPAAQQEIILDGLKAKKYEIRWLYEGEVKRMGERMAKAEERRCKKFREDRCSNVENMQRRIVHAGNAWNNPCERCCDKCEELATCRWACPKLADKAKQLRSDKKAARQQEKEAKEERDRPIIQEIMKYWNRFGEARNAADKSVKDCFKAMDRYYQHSYEREFIAFECLEAKFKTDTNLPYGYSCYLSDVKKFVAVADLLGCSLDYLLCRTDIPQMATAAPTLPEGQLVFAGWMPGGTTPAEPCDVVVKFDLGNEKLHSMLCRWNGEAFLFKAGGEKVNMEPVKWMALPPDADGEGAGG